MQTPASNLSVTEAKKSLRDAVLFAVAYSLPEILQQIQAVDFGEYTQSVSLTCALLIPIVNRFLNLWRI